MTWEKISGIVVDIETFGRTPRSRILSIGACRFNIDTKVIDRHFRVNLDIKSDRHLELQTNKDTLKFWSEVPKEVLKSQMVDAVPYTDGIRQFVDYILAVKPNIIWTWGNVFDLPIVANSIYEIYGHESELPWKYNKICDIRTLKICFDVDIVRSSDHAHDALQDSIDQAQYLIDFFNN